MHSDVVLGIESFACLVGKEGFFEPAISLPFCGAAARVQRLFDDPRSENTNVAE
jgi:hypothetical protein